MDHHNSIGFLICFFFLFQQRPNPIFRFNPPFLFTTFSFLFFAFFVFFLFSFFFCFFKWRFDAIFFAAPGAIVSSLRSVFFSYGNLSLSLSFSFSFSLSFLIFLSLSSSHSPFTAVDSTRRVLFWFFFCFFFCFFLVVVERNERKRRPSLISFFFSRKIGFFVCFFFCVSIFLCKFSAQYCEGDEYFRFCFVRVVVRPLKLFVFFVFFFISLPIRFDGKRFRRRTSIDESSGPVRFLFFVFLPKKSNTRNPSEGMNEAIEENERKKKRNQEKETKTWLEMFPAAREATRKQKRKEKKMNSTLPFR